MGTEETTFLPRSAECGSTTGDVASVELGSGAFAVVDAPTERSRRTWSAGAYDRIAEGFRHEAAAFVGRLGLGPGMDVLDAACGSGNLAIPAARTGARVVGFDLIQSLLDQACAWAVRERVPVRFDQGNVEDLPYADAQFDAVLSMFGVMFAARPDRVAAELARVTRTGGRIALANWTRQGFVGRMLATHVAYVPPPAGASSPLWWGDAAIIADWFPSRLWSVQCTTRTLTFRYPGPPARTAELFRTAYGPTVRALEALDAGNRAAFSRDLEELWRLQQKPGAYGTHADAEYLEVIAIRK